MTHQPLLKIASWTRGKLPLEGLMLLKEAQDQNIQVMRESGVFSDDDLARREASVRDLDTRIGRKTAAVKQAALHHKTQIAETLQVKAV